MKQCICAFLLLIMISPAYAKMNEDLLKANYLYAHLAYHDAISYYQKVAPSLNDPVALSNFGDCYRLTKEPQEANKWYAKAVLLNGCPEETWLHYAQTLMNVGDYTQAMTYIKQYQTANTDDRRAANMIASCENIAKLKSKIPAGSIQLMVFNTDRSEFGPALRKNDLFYTCDTIEKGNAKTDNWTGEPFYNIYSINCNMSGSCTMQKELLGKTNIKYHDGPCTFSKDGNTMYFTRTSYVKKLLTQGPIADKNNIVHLEIMIATDYDEAAGKYKKVTPFKYNNRNYSVAHPAVSKDGNMMLFTSDMKSGEGGTDLYYCLRTSDGNWTSPKSAGININTEGDELFPNLDDNNTLYFASDGHVGYGGLDIYKATWDKTTETFSTPVNMGMPLNTSYDDMSLVFTDNGAMGYFASDRPAKDKGDNIYSYSPQSLYLSVTGIDSFTNMPIPNFNLTLRNPNDSSNLTANSNGKVFTQLYPQVPYTAVASAFNYHPKVIDISNVTGKKATDTIYATVKLTSDATISLNVVVYDRSTRLPLENPTVVFHKSGDRTADTAQLTTGAAYHATLDAGNNYQVFAMKENYYGNEKMISTKGITPKAGSVSIVDTLFMKKLKIGEVYKIDNIYYDYNKANVREDAKPSLDRLLSILNQYPNMKIQVNSHTDCRGADKYNMKLSDARAHSVITYLQQRGISAERLKFKGYGESSPVYKCPKCEQCTETEHQENRRTEFMIIAM